MYYKVEFTPPKLNIKSLEDYKIRVREILFWQVKETISMKWVSLTSIFQITCLSDFFLGLLMLLVGLITLPFTLAYIVLCFVELAVDTILLPLFLIPVVRIIPMIISITVWSLSLAIGYFGGGAIRR